MCIISSDFRVHSCDTNIYQSVSSSSTIYLQSASLVNFPNIFHNWCIFWQRKEHTTSLNQSECIASVQSYKWKRQKCYFKFAKTILQVGTRGVGGVHYCVVVRRWLGEWASGEREREGARLGNTNHPASTHQLGASTSSKWINDSCV